MTVPQVGVVLHDRRAEAGAAGQERHPHRRGPQPPLEHALVELHRLDGAVLAGVAEVRLERDRVEGHEPVDGLAHLARRAQHPDVGAAVADHGQVASDRSAGSPARSTSACAASPTPRCRSSCRRRSSATTSSSVIRLSVMRLAAPDGSVRGTLPDGSSGRPSATARGATARGQRFVRRGRRGVREAVRGRGHGGVWPRESLRRRPCPQAPRCCRSPGLAVTTRHPVTARPIHVVVQFGPGFALGNVAAVTERRSASSRPAAPTATAGPHDRDHLGAPVVTTPSAQPSTAAPSSSRTRAPTSS